MTLKLIPVENSSDGKSKKQKHFNPGNRINVRGKTKDSSLKTICLRLVHFINRGSKFTYQQIDDLILALQHSILKLQKRKQEILQKKNTKFQKKKM